MLETQLLLKMLENLQLMLLVLFLRGCLMIYICYSSFPLHLSISAQSRRTKIGLGLVQSRGLVRVGFGSAKQQIKLLYSISKRKSNYPKASPAWPGQDKDKDKATGDDDLALLLP